MDFHARQYDPQIGRFLGVDPLADNGGQEQWSPYAAMGNNPGMMVDPRGTFFKVFINENKPITNIRSFEAANMAMKQLNAGVSLTISRDPYSGELSFSGTPTTPAERRLAQAISDPTIKINILALSTKIVVGGGFLGNKVDEGSLAGSADNLVVANQMVDTYVLGVMDTYYNKPGAGMLHETIEAYEGAVSSQQSGGICGKFKC